MIAFQSIAGNTVLLDTMIELTFARQSHRIVVAGWAALDVYAALCRRGFCRVATVTRRPPVGGYEISFIGGHQSLSALEGTLRRVTPLLMRCAMVAIWVDGAGGAGGQVVQQVLRREGFAVQSGAKCENGFVLAARRNDGGALADVA